MTEAYGVRVRGVRGKEHGESSQKEKSEHGGHEDPVAEKVTESGSASRSTSSAADSHRHHDRRTDLSN